jgi:DNA replication and repair protein RecF
LQTTIIGPHRDEVSIYINDKLAISFASEGQIRTIAIAMKLAQAEYISSKVGVPPILIVDDIMGELDRSRRIAFLPLLERSHYLKSQVFMTCTEQTWPGELINKMEAWRVSAGSLERYKK